MNSSNCENLKRKNNSLYPEVYGGVDKKKGGVLEKNKRKQKFNFTIISTENYNSKKKSLLFLKNNFIILIFKKNLIICLL